ncbi:hypothetical protein EFN20_00425 [Propionibacterium freudenreichii]|nr:hypothetical protein BMR99_10410 [Propionibacterium freudenreichii]MCT3005473.1 hypothetical protein [Propionibacterium freudenreichii]MCT3006382.1 hypothetical protein [Propionibacterium freudenreichii]MCT3008347.1 hypothetical protein [Propionibacterium freudenreichii]
MDDFQHEEQRPAAFDPAADVLRTGMGRHRLRRMASPMIGSSDGVPRVNLLISEETSAMSRRQRRW